MEKVEKCNTHQHLYYIVPDLYIAFSLLVKLVDSM